MSELDQKSLRTSDSGQNDPAENQDLPIKPATIGWGCTQPMGNDGVNE